MSTKALIVEDSPTQALQLQMILESNDFDTEHSLNGKEALKLLEGDYKPDIVITDIVMPVMDGYELCTSLKANPKTKDIPVIILTQLSDPNDVIKGLQANADNFISKPYTEEFLIERISDLLKNIQLRQEAADDQKFDEIYFAGEKHHLNANRIQVLDLLLSTYYNAINKNKELQEKNEELKSLHKKLSATNFELKESIKEKNHFLGIAAHDLRSPLCTVSSYVNHAVNNIPEGTIQSQDVIFKTIEDQLNYMLNLVSEVLDFARIQSGTLELNLEQVDLKEYMDNIISLNNILSVKKNIQIEPEYADEPMLVAIDKNKFKQIMDNLLSNSVKYSERNTTVSVNMTYTEEAIEISVHDQGIGIPQDKLDQVFQPFSTVTGQGTEGEKSTGLGLVSVKKIVEAHGGNIWAKSHEGVGSQFYFTVSKNLVD